MYSGIVLGASTTVAGVAAIAALPDTGGSRSVVADVAIVSMSLGVAILISTAFRLIAKHRYNG